MGEQDFDPEELPGSIPVFPLPNVVLFPGMLLPLHIFEPRYREMTRQALERERLIAMALLREDGLMDGFGQPLFHPVLGLGRIVEDERLPDGRYNLVLQGLARVRMIEELRADEPFRSVRVEVLQDRPESGVGYERKRRLLLAFYAQILREISKGAITAPPETVPLGLLCDLLTSMLSFEPGLKQELLTQPDAGQRCDRLLDLLRRLKAPLPGEDRPWPPGPSLN